MRRPPPFDPQPSAPPRKPYLRRAALVAEAYDNIDRYLSGGAGFTYKADQTSWGVWTIAPAGTTKEGVDLDGAIHDIYRGGTFPTIGPDGQLYVWEASQANISAAIAAEMAGHREVWDEGDRALLRSIHWMYRTEGIGGATGDDRWQPFVFRRAYGSALMVTMPSSPMTVGKGFGFADWRYAAIDGGPTPGSPTSSPALTATPSPEPTAASAEPTASPAPEPAPSAEPTASPAPEPAPPPSASFTASPTAGTAPLSVSVTDASTGDPTSWLWDYGDGTTTVSGRSPEPHTYSAAGIYTLSLTVANANGSSTASQTISVTSPTSPPSTRIKDITFDPTLTDAVNGVDRISGTVTRDTSTPLAGPGSARIANTAAYVEESFTSTDDLFVTFLLRLPTAPPASARLLMISNGGTVQGNLTLQTNGRLRLRVGSSNIGAESIQLTTGTTWIVGVHQRRGSGKNAVIEAYVAPAGTAFETPFASQTNGTWKAAANRIRLGGTSGSKVNVLLDNALLDGGAMPLTPGT